MKRMAKLTARQKVFCEALLELYGKLRGPVHYSELAKRLGVNRFSAYDMLKVLEKKGFAASSYALEAGHSGPGRPMVVFAPTSQAASLCAAPQDLEIEEWHSLRERVLAKLRQARGANVRETLSDLLARLPETGGASVIGERLTVRLLAKSGIALRRSPKPGAFTAADLNVPRILLTTSVARASTSTSSATMSSCLPLCITFSRTGSRSCTELILPFMNSR